jgi:hypothetical protein
LLDWLLLTASRTRSEDRLPAPDHLTTARRRRAPRHPRLLSAGLRAGAAYDAAFAVLMVASPRLPARLLGLPLPPLPEGAFYLWILAILLLMLAALYVAAAHRPRRQAAVVAIVAVAAAGRIAGGAAFLAAALARGLPGLYPLAAADLAFGVWHLAAWGGWPLTRPRPPAP